ncbi:MAG: hypothetical protein F4Z45_04540, partial [Gammaproteobacteria bacterium]|nr:hypothetical protein [Gammaproteobacteria bacterium]
MTSKAIVLLLFSGVIASCAQETTDEAAAAQSGLPQPKTEPDLLTCQAMNGMSVQCGYQNPEDLVLVPSGDALIVSEMGKFMLDAPGRLSMLD